MGVNKHCTLWYEAIYPKRLCGTEGNSCYNFIYSYTHRLEKGKALVGCSPFILLHFQPPFLLDRIELIQNYTDRAT
ncbi:hypothetical protein J4Q44_G00223180, partial [Coregonus suidteri]